ncbi:IS5 family transposase [Streptomyces olivaceoviridis]|uniref:IS5 family transposase n=1 Tax=Streptomyces olivaceoviridis TaxID=1921 RepID=UPI0036B04BCD
MCRGHRPGDICRSPPRAGPRRSDHPTSRALHAHLPRCRRFPPPHAARSRRSSDHVGDHPSGNAQWARIDPLPTYRTPKRGGRRHDHRQVMEAIAFKYRTGPWMDLPEHFGSWKGAHNRLRKRAADGTAARARQKGLLPASRPTMPSDGPAADRPPRPTSPQTATAARRSTSSRPARQATHPRSPRSCPAVMPRLRLSRRTGRPRVTPDVVMADKAYSSRATRSHLRRHGIRAVIPQPADQAASRKRLGSRGGRPPAFDRDACKQRNTAESCINKLRQWRGLATRYDKTATIYLAGLHLAAVFIWSAS